MTKTERVLHFIGAAGDDGRKFTDIQRFIVEMNGLDWNERSKTYGGEVTSRRRYRGYWTDRLLGGSFAEKTGILHNFCEKNADGRWKLVKSIQEPFTQSQW